MFLFTVHSFFYIIDGDLSVMMYLFFLAVMRGPGGSVPWDRPTVTIRMQTEQVSKATFRPIAPLSVRKVYYTDHIT